MEKLLRKTMVKVDSKVMTLLKGLILSYAITGVFLLLLAFLLYQFKLGEGVISFGIIAVYILATFAGGFFSGKKIKSQKFLWGLCIGAAYFLFLMLISVLVNRGVDGDIKNFVTTLILCVGSGMLGGMVS